MEKELASCKPQARATESDCLCRRKRQQRFGHLDATSKSGPWRGPLHRALVVRRSESSDHHSLSQLCTSQFRPANLAGAGLWKFCEELDFSRIFVWSKLAPHKILKLFLELV